MAGVGAYFRTLRERQGITRAWVAEKAGTSETSLYRIESGIQKPGLEIMLGIIDAVRGSVGDVRDLLRDDNAKEPEGVRRAEVVLTAVQYAEGKRLATDPSTADIARQLAEDPEFFEALAALAVERVRQRSRTRS